MLKGTGGKNTMYESHYRNSCKDENTMHELLVAKY